MESNLSLARSVGRFVGRRCLNKHKVRTCWPGRQISFVRPSGTLWELRRSDMTSQKSAVSREAESLIVLREACGGSPPNRCLRSHRACLPVCLPACLPARPPANARNAARRSGRRCSRIGCARVALLRARVCVPRRAFPSDGQQPQEKGSFPTSSRPQASAQTRSEIKVYARRGLPAAVRRMSPRRVTLLAKSCAFFGKGERWWSGGGDAV